MSVRNASLSNRVSYADQLNRVPNASASGVFHSNTDALYITLFGKAAVSLKEDRKIPESESLRDYFDSVELSTVVAAEALASLLMLKEPSLTRGLAMELTIKAANAVKATIEV